MNIVCINCRVDYLSLTYARTKELVKMIYALTIFALLAIALHVFIWYLESFAWETKATKVFGHSSADAKNTKEIAFNMGFYNLFLAIITAVGLIILLSARSSAGIALTAAGLGSMLAAALLLFFTSPDKRSAALKQGLFPFFGLVFLIFI